MKKVILVVGIILAIAIIALLIVFNFLSKIPGRPAEKFIPSAVTYAEINLVMNDIFQTDTDALCEFPQTAHKITLDNSGLVPDSIDFASENAKKLNDAISKAKKGTTIIIPSGRFYIDKALQLFNKENVHITSADGVTLINSSYSPFVGKDGSSDQYANIFNISYCKNIKLENISFDYLYNTSADGIITRHENGKTFFRVYDEFIDSEKIPLSGGELITSVLCANDTVFDEERWVDGGGTMSLEKATDEGEFFIPMQIANVGDRICCRFHTGPYISYVIHALNTQGLYLENVRCYSCPAGFILAPDGNSDFFFRNIKVEVEKGKEKLLGSNEDCIHLNNFAGKLIVKDSYFTGIGDDALNIHSQVASVDSVDKNTLTISSGREGISLSPIYAFKGETIEFFDENRNSIGFADVKKISGNKLFFSNLPEGAENARYLQNVSCAATTVIDNCTVKFGRARGFLLQTKNAVVKNCNFENLRLSAILMSPDFTYWHEAGFVENILIKDNSFKNCSSLTRDFGVIHASSSHDAFSGSFKCKLGHKNITVCDNTFSDCKSKPIVTYNVQNLKTSNNTSNKGD